jgi:signal transduction histidine kinase/HPt (histidine-containing phosphotransfer) domain-containing protein
MAENNTLLVVDDDKINLFMLINILQPDYTVYNAINGEDALKKAEKFLPDLILLDIVMPGIDGYETFARLQRSDATKDIPIIFITGLSESSSEEKGLKMGAVDYIVKPFNPVIVKIKVTHQIKIINLQRALADAAEAEKKANEAKSSFLASMSHEIRTPMNAILGVTEILIQRKDLHDEIREGLSMVYNSCDLLLGIINDILDFSKVEAGRMEIVPAKYLVSSLINDCVQLNMMRIGSKPIDFKLEINEDMPAALIGDELRLKQVFNNLLSNAFKYTEAGFVTLTVATEDADETDTALLTLSVRDSGRGMSEEQLRVLFDEYTRFEEGRGKAIEGTGLGLTITRRVIGLMHGEINVESEPGVGSVFTVQLPQGKTDGGVLGEEVAQNLRQCHVNYIKYREIAKIKRDPMPYGSVLIVDDMQSNLYVAMGLMKLYNLRIDTALGGRATIEKINCGNTYDVIFMDHMMPEPDGIETTKLLREAGYVKPIIALTANAVVGQADIFLQNGFNDFIAKPIDTRQLNIVLNKFVRDKYPREVVEAARRNKQEYDGSTSSATESAFPQLNAALLNSLVKDIQKAVAALDEFIENAGFENGSGLLSFVITVHGMKSSLLNIGENELSEAARNLETAGREKNMSAIKESAPVFLKNLQILLKKLEAKLAEAGRSEEDEGILRDKLLSIARHCAEYNRRGALDIIVTIKNNSPVVTEKLGKLSEHIMQGEFEEAESVAAALAEGLKLSSYRG